MVRPRKRAAAQSRPAEDDVRTQEVLRANRELAAYFKGRRTEREARAALKIIKAFIRERERADPSARRPLPIARPAKDSKTIRRLLRPVPSHPPAHRSALPDETPGTTDEE
jgi:hypothetical protein